MSSNDCDTSNIRLSGGKNDPRRRNGHLVVQFFVLFGLLVGCGQPPTSSPVTSGEVPEVRQVSMRLQWIPQYQFAGYLVAKVKGYYEEAGLIVSIHPGGPDFVPMPLVVSGSDTFGSTGADTILLARQKGIEVVALATIFQESPVGFMVHRDSGIKTPQDFVGRTVGVFYGDNVDTEYRALLAATGVNRQAIREVPAQFNLEPFLSRRVDVWPVYVTDQPNTARQRGADVEVIVARDYGVHLMGDVLFATEQFVRTHPITTRAFVHATLRGWEDALQNPDEAITLIRAYNNQLSLDQLQFEAQATIPLIRSGKGKSCPGWNDLAKWQAERQLLEQLGLLTMPIAVEEAIFNAPVESYYAGRSCGNGE